MKDTIHPAYAEATVSCGCGETFKTRSTKPIIKVEICSKCHPFYTGKERLVDSTGMVERFQKRYNWSNRKQTTGAPAAPVEPAATPVPAAPAAPAASPS